MFEQRFRVTPRHVAEVVESLQEAAAQRRRESLTAASDAASAVLEQADVEARVLGSVRTSPAAPSPIAPPPAVPAGPPRPGTEDDRDSAPLISVEPYEPTVHTEPTSPGRKAPRELKATTPVPVRAPGAPGDPLAELRLELEAELPGGARPPPHGAPTQQAVRYPSIEAAINALSPLGPDPSAEDFDGKPESGARPKAGVKPAPEEVAAAPQPPPPIIGEIAAPADDTGDFAVTPALTVLFRLMTSRATGLLVCSIGGIKKEIYVRDGMPEYVSSNVASELFGNYLVGQGILSEGELAMALAMMPHYGGKLGDTLVGLGLLRPLEVFRHLTRQVRAKLVDVCTWGKGSFGWYAGRENPREAFPLDLNGFEVLGAGAMALSDDAVDAWALRQRGTKLKAVKSGRIGPQRFELAGLRELHERLDGRRSVGELLDVYTDAAERRRTGRLLILLQQSELAKSG
jgi:hypothetical protein